MIYHFVRKFSDSFILNLYSNGPCSSGQTGRVPRIGRASTIARAATTNNRRIRRMLLLLLLYDVHGVPQQLDSLVLCLSRSSCCLASTASRAKLSPKSFPQRQAHAMSPFPSTVFRQCSSTQACRSHGSSGPSGPPSSELIDPLRHSLLPQWPQLRSQPRLQPRSQHAPYHSSIIGWWKALYQAGGTAFYSSLFRFYIVFVQA